MDQPSDRSVQIGSGADTPRRSGGRPRGRRKKILTAVLAPLIVLGLGELALRLGGFTYDPAADFAPDGRHDEQAEEALYRTDPSLLWTLQPSTVLHRPDLGFVETRTNATGLRGRELPAKRPEGELRVLCLGDSTTFGLGLPDDETWPARTEEALRASDALHGRSVQVVNGGIPGWTSLQGMRLLDRLEGLDPDVVVFWFGMNDAKPARDFPDRAQGIPSAARRRTQSVLRYSRVYQLIQSVVTGARRRGDAGHRVSPAEFAEAVDRLKKRESDTAPEAIFIRSPECCDLTIRQMARVVARAEEEGVETVEGPSPLLSCYEPAPEGADLDGRRITRRGIAVLRFEPLRDGSRYSRVDRRIPVAELKADLERLRKQKRGLDERLEALPEGSLDHAGLFGSARPGEIFQDNCHLTREGAQAAGRVIAGEILRRLAARPRSGDATARGRSPR